MPDVFPPPEQVQPGYTGPDPTLREPRFQRFVPPGFTGDRFDLVQQQPLAASAMQQFVQQQAEEQARQRELEQMLMQASRQKDAVKAVAEARRFQGISAFNRDVDSGIPVPIALSKHATSMFYNSPASMQRALTAGQTPAPVPFSNVANPIKTPEGEVIAYGAESSAKGRHILPVPKPKPSGTLTDVEKSQIHRLEKRESDLEKEMGSSGWMAQEGLPEYVESHKQKQKELQDIKARLEGFGKEESVPVKTSRIKVRRKSDKKPGTILESDFNPELYERVN